MAVFCCPPVVGGEAFGRGREWFNASTVTTHGDGYERLKMCDQIGSARVRVRLSEQPAVTERPTATTACCNVIFNGLFDDRDKHEQPPDKERHKFAP